MVPGRNPVNQENNTTSFGSPKAWGLFIFGLFIATIIGLTVRTLLSPQQLDQWIQSHLQQNPVAFDLEYKKVSLKLARSVWPYVGLEFNELSLRPRALCQSHVYAKFNRVDLPLSLLGLLQGEFKLAGVNLVGGKVSLGEKNQECSASAQKNDPVVQKKRDSSEPPKDLLTPNPSMNQKSIVSPLVDSVKIKIWNGDRAILQKKRLISWFQKALSQTEQDKWVEKFHQVPLLRASQIEFEGLLGKSFVRFLLQDLFFRASHNPAQQSHFLSLDLKPLVPMTKSFWQEPVQLEVQLGQQAVEVELKTQTGEGQVRFNGLYSATNDELSLNAKIQHLPIGQLKKTKGLEEALKDMALSKMWFSCEANFSESNSSQSMAGFVVVEPCQLEGEFGKIRLNPTFVKLSKGQVAEPLVLNFEKINMRPMIQIFNRIGPSGIMSDYGSLVGSLLVYSKKHLVFKGQLNQAVVTFSNQGERGRQVINELVGELEYKQDRVSGIIRQINFDQGEYRGHISFNFDQKLKNGLARLGIDSLAFHDSIQKLMIGGRLNPMSIFGEIQIREGEIHKWEGSIGSQRIEGENFHGENLKLKSTFLDGRYQARLTTDILTIGQSHFLYPRLSPLFLNLGESASELVFNKVSGQLSLTKSAGVWRRFYLKSVNNTVLSSNGEWKEGELQGSIDVDLARLKMLKWDITGPIRQPKIVPSLSMIKRLTRQGQRVQIPNPLKLIEIDQVNSAKEGQFEVLKKLRDSAIKAAKKIIPGAQPKVDIDSSEANTTKSN